MLILKFHFARSLTCRKILLFFFYKINQSIKIRRNKFLKKQTEEKIQQLIFTLISFYTNACSILYMLLRGLTRMGNIAFDFVPKCRDGGGV